MNDIFRTDMNEYIFTGGAAFDCSSAEAQWYAIIQVAGIAETEKRTICYLSQINF